MISKLGIVQNAPQTADLSNNLRQIVQGYRECLDHGAQFIIASGNALCGHELQSLANRRSFVEQTQAALKALAAELGQVPLLLGAYACLVDKAIYSPGSATKIRDEYDLLCNEEAEKEKVLSAIVPVLLTHNSVVMLPEGEVSEIAGMRAYVDCDDMIIHPDFDTMDIIVRLPVAPWYSGAEGEDRDTRFWEAETCKVPVVQVCSVGTADDKLFAGGSAVYLPDGKSMEQLPFFEPYNKVVNLKKTKGLAKGAETLSVLCKALVRGIRDTVRNNGYSGASICMDQRNAPLLAALCVLALGSDNVCAVTFEGNTDMAKGLGISCRKLDVSALATRAATCIGGDSPILRRRLEAALQSTLSDERGLMQLTALSRDEIMTGEFTLYGESCGGMAPLGYLYEDDICEFYEELKDIFPCLADMPQEGDNSDSAFIIQDLADKNLPASVLLEGRGSFDYEENDVRLIQRKIQASALKRSQFPMCLHIEPREDRHTFPIAHRLND